MPASALLAAQGREVGAVAQNLTGAGRVTRDRRLDEP
jgi:hypothetical protein